MTSPPFEAVVFDLDGTLADTAGDVQQALAAALASEGLPPVELGAVRFMIGNGPEVLVKRALQRLAVEEDAELVQRLTTGFHAAYLRQGNARSRLYDGAAEGLEYLRANAMRTGICSNKTQDLCEKLVRDLGIAGSIDVIQGSEPGLPRKPDPAPLLHVVGRLGASRETTLYVGDSATDVATARAAGVPVVLVSYGYSARPATQLGANDVYDRISDIFKLGPLRRSA